MTKLTELNPLGLGCMGMSEFYGATDDANSQVVLERAYALGVRHFDTADTYGFGHNEQLVGSFAKGRADVFVATKFGIVRRQGEYERTIDNSRAYVREACDASLARLGAEQIDLYYAHRRDERVSIEDTVGAMAELVEAGKVRYLGLSEVSAETLRRACAVHPIAALQSEYSLTSRDVEADVLPACRELGVTFVAYSPLGRGLLTGAIEKHADLKEDDFHRHLPRFSGDNLEQNVGRLELLKNIAAAHDATPAQIALAWVLAQGCHVIPGTKRVGYLEDNVKAAKITLTANDLEQLDAAYAPGWAQGARYPDSGWVGIDAR